MKPRKFPAVCPDSPARVVLTTFGSLGDLYPYMAIAVGLQARGHRATIATCECHRRRIEAEGIRFHAVRPDLADLAENRDFLKRILDRRKGPEYAIRRVLMPHLAASYDDLTAAVCNADLLVTHSITFAGPLVAEATGVCWVSSVLMPLKFYSAYDPSVHGAVPGLTRLRVLGPTAYGVLLKLGKLGVRSWSEPERRLRRRLGLPPGNDPIFEGQHSPELVLALFSAVLGCRQPDWPPQTRITGFPFYDERASPDGLPAALRGFLDVGPPPIVFTLGSAAAMDPGRFYTATLRAVRELGCRAVLVVAKGTPVRLPDPLPEGIMAIDSVAYSQLLPRAAAVVHHAGIGTTGQALRAGCPMLVVPYCHDQPDNAARVCRLGVARSIARDQYTSARAASELHRLLRDGRYAARAREISLKVRKEDGVRAACDAIEERLYGSVQDRAESRGKLKYGYLSDRVTDRPL
jgi:rhamnosyltransferase subunit B